MANEKKKIIAHPILDLIMRLVNVYLVAHFFFTGLQYWNDSEFLLAITNFALVIVEIGIVFDWLNKNSKILRVLILSLAAVALVCLALSKILS